MIQLHQISDNLTSTRPPVKVVMMLCWLLVLLLLVPSTTALSNCTPLPRKAFLRVCVPLLPLAFLPASPTLTYAASPGTVKPPTVEEARARLASSRETLDALLSDYPSISAKGGDEIRRYLGTVGTTSPLLGIRTTLKVLQDSAEDIVTYTEAMETFDRILSSADQEAYSSMFVEFSAAKGKPEDFYERARKDIEIMAKQAQIMSAELK